MKNLYKQRQFNFVVMNVSGRLLPLLLLLLLVIELLLELLI